MVELAEDVFLKPVRIGSPVYAGGLSDVVRSPRYATAVGLLEEAVQQRHLGHLDAGQDGSFTGAIKKVRTWFKGTF